MRMFENIKQLMETYAAYTHEDGHRPNPRYRRSALSWSLQCYSRHWGVDGPGDVYLIVQGYYLLREYKGRGYYNERKVRIQAMDFYDRIQAN
jgi:hypothetical protein